MTSGFLLTVILVAAAFCLLAAPIPIAAFAKRDGSPNRIRTERAAAVAVGAFLAVDLVCSVLVAHTAWFVEGDARLCGVMVAEAVLALAVAVGLLKVLHAEEQEAARCVPER